MILVASASAVAVVVLVVEAVVTAREVTRKGVFRASERSRSVSNRPAAAPPTSTLFGKA